MYIDRRNRDSQQSSGTDSRRNFNKTQHYSFTCIGELEVLNNVHKQSTEFYENSTSTFI
jgi:hypothetical protein